MKIDIKNLRRIGARITKARTGITNILNNTTTPLSASEIGGKLASRKIPVNKSTIYRELAFLLEQHLIREVIFKDQIKRYELSSNHHHHLVCRDCKRINDFDCIKKIKRALKNEARNQNFLIKDHSLEVFGKCVSCQK